MILGLFCVKLSEWVPSLAFLHQADSAQPSWWDSLWFMSACDWGFVPFRLCWTLPLQGLQRKSLQRWRPYRAQGRLP